ncbi:MAG: diguanylate cyclase [Candidatus Cloacimonetes bacterium]|jgi:diguanylate cyclase (GGDEF)-like protein/PAS domain S-box-containing protein|nr:diguanylate cyclase [Candidatus Cloacimonadota bacterium]MDD4034677.1 diguanylate cyclase [Candidatus Cloacimonadota bacterium]MDY0337150.1 diguanylate cyclase [Candidatus Cloacimonadaceae bacterium]HPF08906.1 diguanylate cyclase [Candidatus Cloacimonadota bacterium]
MDNLKLESLYSRIFNSSVVAIGLTDVNGRYQLVNPAWSSMLGYSAEEAMNLKIEDVTPPEDRAGSMLNYDRLISGETTSIRIQRRYLCKNQDIIWADLHVSAITDNENHVLGVLGMFVNIDPLMAAEDNMNQLNHELTQANIDLQIAIEKLNKLARRDELTGLYNRRVLDEAMEHELQRSSRTKRGFTVAIADLDDFKKVNDTYGHDCGDEALKALADVLKNGVRAMDSVGRWGGEEFLFVLPETSMEGSRIVLDRIRRRVSEIELHHNGNEVRFTISIGMSYCQGACFRDNVIKEADLALYEAKRTGKNKLVCYQGISKEPGKKAD